MSKLFTGKNFPGKKSHWTIVSLDNCVIGQKSLGQLSPWTIVPWTIVATPYLGCKAFKTESISHHDKAHQVIPEGINLLAPGEQISIDFCVFNDQNIFMVKDRVSGLICGKLTKNQTSDEAFGGVMEQRIARLSSKSQSRQLLSSRDQSRSRQPLNYPVSTSLGLDNSEILWSP